MYQAGSKIDAIADIVDLTPDEVMGVIAQFSM